MIFNYSIVCLNHKECQLPQDAENTGDTIMIEGKKNGLFGPAKDQSWADYEKTGGFTEVVKDHTFNQHVMLHLNNDNEKYLFLNDKFPEGMNIIHVNSLLLI